MHESRPSAVVYKISKEFDIEVAPQFIGKAAGGIDFSGGITRPHPELASIGALPKDEQKEKITSYFNDFYRTNEAKLEEKRKEFQDAWNKVEERYFKAAASVFGVPVAPAEYTGFLSIVNCNPRFVDRNSFQVFWQHRAGAVYVTAHEVLHFLFFAYVRSKYPETLGKLNTNNGVLWEVSELFDDVILSRPEFTALHNHRDMAHYPDIEPHFKKSVALWEEKKKDIDYWLTETFKGRGISI